MNGNKKRGYEDGNEKHGENRSGNVSAGIWLYAFPRYSGWKD
jgi:hypothetical protein